MQPGRQEVPGLWSSSLFGPHPTSSSLDVRELKANLSSRPLKTSRHLWSHSQDNLHTATSGRTTVDEVDLGLRTPRRRPVHGARRTVSFSNVPQPTGSVGWGSRVTTPRSLPGIPWGQVPGLSGTRAGTILPISSEDGMSPSSMLPKGQDYAKRVKLITKVLFGEAARLHRSFAMCFNYSITDTPEVSPQVGPNITPRLGTDNMFDISLVLRPPVPAEAFEIMSSLPRDAAPGHAVARLNPSLTPAEKVKVKRTWGQLLLQDQYLTPALVHQCIADAIQKAIFSLDKVRIGRDLYGVIPSCSAPQLTLMVSYINMDTISDSHNSSFTINILPVIIAAGIPRVSGFQMRMPVPHVLPFSRVGTEIMREFDEEVQDWTLFWCLEARHVKIKPKPVVPGFLQGVITKRSRLKKEKLEQEKNGPLPMQTNLKSWVISFEPLERRLLELCLKKGIFSKAKEAYELFDDMIPEFGEEWAYIPQALTTSLKLWTLYKTAVKNKTALDWLKALMWVIHESLRQRFCAYFLLPRINMLSHVDKKHINSLRKKLQNILQAESQNGQHYASGQPNTMLQRSVTMH